VFLSLDLPVLGDDPETARLIVREGYDVAQRLSCSFYDGVFMAVAERLGAPLVTADARAYRSLADHTDLVVWIGDIQIP